MSNESLQDRQPQQPLWDTDASKLTVNTRYAMKRYRAGYNTGHAEGYQSGYLEGVKVNSAQTAELKVRVAELEQERATLTARVADLEQQLEGAKAWESWYRHSGEIGDSIIAGQASRIIELEQQLEESQASFDMRHDSDMTAIKLWQEATGEELKWPNHTDLCMWLMQRLAQAQGRWEPVEDEGLLAVVLKGLERYQNQIGRAELQGWYKTDVARKEIARIEAMLHELRDVDEQSPKMAICRWQEGSESHE